MTSHRDRGVTLVEVLVAIFIMGVGLLALLTLFPLGALRMAEAIKDDRAAAVATDAVALGAAGEQLLSETGAFVIRAIANESIDPQAAALLRERYEDLLQEADDLEDRLRALGQLFPPEQIRPHLGPLLGQLHAIRSRLMSMTQILRLLERTLGQPTHP